MEATHSLFSPRPRWVVAAAVALTVVMWGACVYSISSQIGHPFPGFFYTPDRTVSGFTPRDFSGWQAGVRPADFLVSVNGQPWQEMPRLVGEAGINGTVDYTLERGGQSFSVAVPVMEFTTEILLRFLPGQLLFSVVMGGIALFVYTLNPASRLNLYVLLYFLLWEVGVAFCWNYHLSQQKWATYLFHTVIAVVCVTGWTFFWSFPADAARREFLARWRVIPAFLAFGVTASVYYPVLRFAVYHLDRPEWWRWLILSDTWISFVILAGGSLVLKTVPLLQVILLKRYAPRLRRQAAVLLAGLTVGLGSFTFFIWAPMSLDIAAPVDPQWGVLPTLFYPLAFGYAVLRYQLFDIRLVIRKGLIYSLLTAALTAVFLLLSVVSGYLLQGLTGRQSLLSAVLPAVVVAALFQPARSLIQTRVDRAFFRREFEVRQTLSHFSRQLTTLHDRREIMRSVVDTATSTLGATGGVLWLRDDQVYRPAETEPGAPLVLAAQSSLAVWLSQQQRPLLAVPGDRSPEVQQLLQISAVLAVPILVGDNLLGILTLGEQKSGVLYNQEDLDLLATLAQNTGLALENARLQEERVAILHRQLAQVVTAQEEERERIARELHDGVGPALASLNLRLQTAGKQLQRDQLAVEEIEELANLTQANIRDIRRLIYDLRPAALDELGLVPVLHDYAAQWGQEHGVDIAVSLPEDNERLSSALETALFRIVQEGLANVARHAHAGRVALTLQWDQQAVHLCLADDGQGFDLNEAVKRARQGGHLGLWSMRERVEQFGGQLAVDSAPGQGTRLNMTIPRQNANEQDTGAD